MMTKQITDKLEYKFLLLDYLLNHDSKSSTGVTFVYDGLNLPIYANSDCPSLSRYTNPPTPHIHIGYRI